MALEKKCKIAEPEIISYSSAVSLKTCPTQQARNSCHFLPRETHLPGKHGKDRLANQTTHNNKTLKNLPSPQNIVITIFNCLCCAYITKVILQIPIAETINILDNYEHTRHWQNQSTWLDQLVATQVVIVPLHPNFHLTHKYIMSIFSIIYIFFEASFTASIYHEILPGKTDRLNRALEVDSGFLLWVTRVREVDLRTGPLHDVFDVTAIAPHHEEVVLRCDVQLGAHRDCRGQAPSQVF